MLPISKEKFNVSEVFTKHEVTIQVKERKNSISNINRRSIYWTRSSISTPSIYIENFLKEILKSFYKFLPTSVVGSEREQALSLLGGHGRR